MFAIVANATVVALSPEQPGVSEEGHVIAGARRIVGLAAPEVVACGHHVQRGWKYADGVFAPPRSATQAFEDLIAAGLTISSVSTPALNGVYALDAVQRARLERLLTYVNAYKVFPAGAVAVALRRIGGGRDIEIVGVSAFRSVARAIADYVFVLEAMRDAAGLAAEPAWAPSNVTLP